MKHFHLWVSFYPAVPISTLSGERDILSTKPGSCRFPSRGRFCCYSLPSTTLLVTIVRSMPPITSSSSSFWFANLISIRCRDYTVRSTDFICSSVVYLRVPIQQTQLQMAHIIKQTKLDQERLLIPPITSTNAKEHLVIPSIRTRAREYTFVIKNIHHHNIDYYLST